MQAESRADIVVMCAEQLVFYREQWCSGIRFQSFVQYVAEFLINKIDDVIADVVQ